MGEVLQTKQSQSSFSSVPILFEKCVRKKKKKNEDPYGKAEYKSEGRE